MPAPALHGGTALKSLHVIPQAAADKSLPKEGLYFLASQAEVDITLALYPAAGACDLTPQQQLQLALEQASQKGQVSSGTGHSTIC